MNQIDEIIDGLKLLKGYDQYFKLVAESGSLCAGGEGILEENVFYIDRGKLNFLGWHYQNDLEGWQKVL